MAKYYETVLAVSEASLYTATGAAMGNFIF